MSMIRHRNDSKASILWYSSFLIPFFGLPWELRWSRICLQCRRPGFDLWVRKIPCRRAWQPTPVCSPGEFYEQESSAYSPWGGKELDTTKWLTLCLLRFLNSFSISSPHFWTWFLLDWRDLFRCLFLQGSSLGLLTGSGSSASLFCLCFSLWV